jgi:hypothetical protein
MKHIFFCLAFSMITLSPCFAETGAIRSIRHQIETREDGGYIITISGHKRYLLPITAEGPFPKMQINCRIELKGKGKDWSYRNQPGYYYSYPDDIECKSPRWDIGYAWVDKDRKKIYLNFFWIHSPDSLTDSDVNGAYRIEIKAEQDGAPDRR